MNWIKPQWIFPLILTILDFGAALVYLFKKDYPRFMYWFCAGLLTISVILQEK